MANVTNLLERVHRGDGQAVSELFAIVYDELRRLAKYQLDGEKPGQTLQPTALVNEAYVRLVGSQHDRNFSSRGGFFSAASEAMRCILVDIARQKMAMKRGGDARREQVEVDQILLHSPREILDVHEALEALAQHDTQSSEVVKLHYFGGYSLAEIAELQDLSRSTVNRLWVYARAWLKTYISKDANDQ